MTHVRDVGRANRTALSAIAADLAKAGMKRTEVRVLDVLLWSSHPGSSLPFTPDRFERRIRVADEPNR